MAEDGVIRLLHHCRLLILFTVVVRKRCRLFIWFTAKMIEYVFFLMQFQSGVIARKIDVQATAVVIVWCCSLVGTGVSCVTGRCHVLA